MPDRKSTRLNSSHVESSYAVFCLKKKKRHCCRRSGSARRSWRYPGFSLQCSGAPLPLLSFPTRRSSDLLGSQLVTTRVAFGDPATTNRALIAIFLRGGMDGLSVVVPAGDANYHARSEEHTSELQSRRELVCRLLLEKKKTPLLSAQRLSAS